MILPYLEDLLGESVSAQKWYEPHPFAQVFPRMPKVELIELARSIEQDGQLEPAAVFEGFLLDGVSRQEASNIVGAPLYMREFTGNREDALRFLAAVNLNRRNLSASQRALIAADLMMRSSLNREKAAQQLAISARSLSSAKRVLEQGASHVVQLVRDDRLKVSVAERFTQKYPISLQHYYSSTAAIREAVATSDDDQRPLAKIRQVAALVLEVESHIDKITDRSKTAEICLIANGLEKAKLVISDCDRKLRSKVQGLVSADKS